ncbi:hypothetical protein EBR57_10090 [bacterium]|nr:hypothetical protein [bacterium]
MNPGIGVPGIDARDRLPGESFVDGANCWGNNVENKPRNVFENFINDVFPGREGGPLSIIANQIPGQNAFSYLHDSWGNSWASGWAVGDIPFAQLTTYSAYIRSVLP